MTPRSKALQNKILFVIVTNENVNENIFSRQNILWLCPYTNIKENNYTRVGHLSK